MKQPRCAIIPPVLLALAMAFAACGGPSTQPQDIGLDDGTPPDTMDTAGDSIDGESDVPEDPSVECVPTGAEMCDGLDNDCNGAVDDGFALASDPANCGACGYVCVTPNATPGCTSGACVIGTCNTNFYDINGSAWDGCEYFCTPTAGVESAADGTCSDLFDNDCDGRTDSSDPDCSACVPEFCDLADNDCDTFVDEDYDLRSDPNNCGTCGTACPGRPHSAPACVLGTCTVTCEAGWSNLDGNDLNGCEAPCVPDTGSDEFGCDGLDADCDGSVDEDYIPYTCGVGLCVADSVCWHGAEQCEALDPLAALDTVCDGADEDCDGSVDEEYLPSPACIGLCRTTATCSSGIETCGTAAGFDGTCDNVDDDCDMAADEDYTPYTCGSGGCTRQSTCIGGIENCVEGGPAPELCNGSDDNCDDMIDNGDPATMCTPPPPHGTGTCSGGLCSVGSCVSPWYDTDGVYGNGCECQPESTEALSTSCSAAHNLGTYTDNPGSTTTVSGNIVPAGDEDWYTFTATDSADSSADSFDTVVAFTSNPGTVFRMDIYRGSCSDGAPCTNVADLMEWYANFRSGSMEGAVGENPCSTSVAYGSNICADNGATFYVRVYRVAGPPVTCDNYTIRISNGM